MAEAEKNDEYIELLKQIVKELRFGSVTLTVQDGKVVQIQKEEKIRIKTDWKTRGFNDAG